MTNQILLTALVTWLALWVEHWFPWRLLLRQDLPNLASYVLGVLALVGPLSVLYWHWTVRGIDGLHLHLIALWIIVIVGGMAVSCAYLIDWLLGRLALATELGELFDGLRDGKTDK